MPRNSLTAWVLLLYASGGSAQVTILVPGDQPTIQDGINTASSGDTVRVDPIAMSLTPPDDVDVQEAHPVSARPPTLPRTYPARTKNRTGGEFVEL